MSEIPVPTAMIAQAQPGAFFAEHRDEVQRAMLRVLDSGWYVLGEEVRTFEEEFASHFGFVASVGVANGTDAIALALRSLNVGLGHRVATVSHTAVATVAAIEMTGAEPVFIDISPDTYTMDPESLSRTLKRTQLVKAVIPVHLYGHPADMPAITSIAREHGAFVVEDCSQAHGATLNGLTVGSMGDIGAFSFYPTKNLGGIGDGGMVVSNNSGLVRRIRSLREYGWVRRYISEEAGVNSRLDELQAAVLRVRLPYLEAENGRRRAIARAYTSGLESTGVTIPITRPWASHVFHQFVLRYAQRDQLRERLKDAGIGTNIHYPVPIHRQNAYASRCATDPKGLEMTDQVASEVLSLPIYPELRDEDVDAVIVAVRRSL